MTLKYCAATPDGGTVFGWGRRLSRSWPKAEAGSSVCRRKRLQWPQTLEEQHPQVAQALRQLPMPMAQQSPTFRTSLTYTRLRPSGCNAERTGYSEEQLPSPSTMAEGLNSPGLSFVR